MTVTPPISFYFFWFSDPSQPVLSLQKELLAEEAIMHQSGEGVHNLEATPK